MGSSDITLAYYLNLRYPIALDRDPEGGYVAQHPDLPGCITQGETLKEVAQNLDDARQLWLEVAHDNGDAIPLPTCEHPQCTPKFDAKKARGQSKEFIREQWPRFFGRCPDCRAEVIAYASKEHYVMGDW